MLGRTGDLQRSRIELEQAFDPLFDPAQVQFRKTHIGNVDPIEIAGDDVIERQTLDDSSQRRRRRSGIAR